MDGRAFDRMTRAIAGRRRPRRGVLWAGAVGVLGVVLGRRPVAAGCVDPDDRCGRDDRCCDGHCRRGRCRCGNNKRACGRRCIPENDCCSDGDCGTNERCAGGECEACLGQGITCTADAQCCTGICDLYTDKCQQVRVDCETDDQCPGGRCCGTVPNKQCLYETATQRECDPGVSCGYLLCGDRCSDLGNGEYQYCGFDGSAACRRGRCCCPEGIPLADCPDIDGPEPGKNLPRCD